MLRKRLYVYLYSLKSSVKKKPMALVMLILVAAVSIISCSWASRITINEAEYALYGSLNAKVKDDLSIVAVGDAMRDLRKDGLFAYNALGFINISIFDLTASKDAEKINYDATVSYMVFSNDYISETDILEKKSVMAVNEYFLEINNKDVGDEILFCGTNFTIINVKNQYNDPNKAEIYLPYTINLPDVDINSKDITAEGVKVSDIKRLAFQDMQRSIRSGEKNLLGEIGVVVEDNQIFTSSVIMGLCMMAIFIAVSVINTLVILRYWLKVNDKKYAVYKIVGAKPTAIATCMLGEGMVATVVGIGLGVAIEMFLSKLFMSPAIINKLLWVHYTVLITTTLLSSLIPLLIRVIRRAKASAIDRKMLI